MRKNHLTFLVGMVISCAAGAQTQDSLKTTMLQEVVTTGTKFEVPVEKSGKSIYTLSAQDIERNAGKSLADVLMEVPGVHTDGNFGTPGSNLSYYVRGARNRSTLVLIDGVPINDPSAINAEYDLRYIPLAQIESIEVLKGGLSTLYGTGAAAGVINIRLKDLPKKPFNAQVDVNAASFNTFSQAVNVQGARDRLSFLVSANNVTSEGLSSAEDQEPSMTFDKDGFSRQNVLAKIGYDDTKKFKVNFFTAYEQFEADYDEYEFTDGANVQEYNQVRFGINPTLRYNRGDVEAKVVYNVNNRLFKSSFPAEYNGRNTQAEIIQRHHFSNVVQGLIGLNYQHMAYDQEDAVDSDSANIYTLDPYASLLVDHPSGLNVHAGVRLNTHKVYGSKVVYNLNPSFLLNKNKSWNYKVFASVSSSYITPSLYQLFSIYGNKALNPEEAVNYEGGLSVYFQKRLVINTTIFRRDETQPIDFISLFDEEGNYIGSQYQNLTSERMVKGVEFDASYRASEKVDLSANYTRLDTDQEVSFYRIPKNKAGAAITYTPSSRATLSVKYNFVGDRTTFDYNNFAEVTLDRYQLIDVFASYRLFNNKLLVYGAVNNVLDEEFIAILGYTTRGRNASIGLRYEIR